MGGVQGKTALTAYVAIALLEAGDKDSAAKAVGYLEGQLDEIDDPYTMAIVSYALELAESPSRDDAHDKLMEMAEEDENGLHWGSDIVLLRREEPQPGLRLLPESQQSTVIEATAYATLALTKHGDALNAGQAARWLVSQRNAYGGFGSTQDTVVALQALTEQAVGAAADVDLTVTINAGGETKVVNIDRRTSTCSRWSRSRPAPPSRCRRRARERWSSSWSPASTCRPRRSRRASSR